MADSERIEFKYKGGSVGVLRADSLPENAGIISYMPYRSGSHYLLHRDIAEGHAPTCTFEFNSVNFSFIVESTPGYGQLQIRSLRRQ